MGRSKAPRHIPTKSKLKKDPGIPKLPNLKQKVDAQMRKASQKLAGSPQHETDATMASEPTLSSLAQLAASANAEGPGEWSGDPSSSTGGLKVQMRKHYIRTLHKVIDESDIVILVLDARDPEGCRSRLVEEEVRRRDHEGKKLVFVLNKIDLVPRTNAEAWLRYLRHYAPTLPFRSSTQQQRTNITSRTSPALLNLLKAYKHGTRSVTVGVVGYPNVGKSSLINSLKRAKVCAIAAEAGHTKEMQAVQIDRGIRVLDSPGVVFDDDDQESSNVLLRNVVKVEDIDDPIAVVEQVLLRTNHETLQNIYKLPHFTSTLEFLTMLALSAGRLLKGGTPDIIAAARQVIQDWNSQKIPYFTNPPTIHPSSLPSVVSSEATAKYGLSSNIAPGAEDVGQLQIVQSFAPAFNIDLGGLFNQADTGAFTAPDADMSEDVKEDEPVEMESDDLLPNIPRKRSRSASPQPSANNESPMITTPNEQASFEPPMKRQKKEAPTYDMAIHVKSTAGIAVGHNTLSRALLKREAKRARKAARRQGAKGAGVMEIDDDHEGDVLPFTFMAGIDGVVA